jgi:hypothetical protein
MKRWMKTALQKDGLSSNISTKSFIPAQPFECYPALEHFNEAGEQLLSTTFQFRSLGGPELTWFSQLCQPGVYLNSWPISLVNRVTLGKITSLI